MRNLKRTLTVLLSALLILALMPVTAFARGTAAVASRAIHFRSSGSMNSEILDVVPRGTSLEVLAREGKWTRVIFNNRTGWVSADLIASEKNSVSPVEGTYQILDEITVYMSAMDARAGRNAAGTYKAGEYFIYKNFSGMINVTRNRLEPGAWIDPSENRGLLPGAPVKKGVQSTSIKTATVPAAVVITSALDTYLTASDAGQRTNSVGKYEPGSYFVFREYSGMYNLSRSEGSPGAWVNMADNVAPETDARDHADTIVSRSSVNVRSGAGNGFPITRNLTAGAKAVLTGIEGNWLKIDLNGKAGYTHINYWNVSKALKDKFTRPKDHPDTIVNTSSVNVRSGAGSSYSVIRNLAGGSKAVLTGIEGNWLKIDLDGKAGYTSMSYWNVSKALKDKFTPAKDHPDTIVNTSSVNVRSGAGSSYSVIRNLAGGSKAVLTGIEGNWLKIDLDGKAGYTSMSYWNVPKALKDKFTPAKDHPDTIVSTSSVNLRESAGNSSRILRNVPAGTKAVLKGIDGSWVRIDYSGQTGYSHISYWKISETILKKFAEPKKDPINKKYKVFLDPGHMGYGTGASSTITGERVDENDINYQVAVHTRDILEKQGYTVYLSKKHSEDPVGLLDRSRQANDLGADIFVSIHCNSFSSSVPNGTLSFYGGQKNNPTSKDWQKQSKLLSQLVARNVGSLFGSHNALSDTSYGISFSVNRNSNMPSTLLELGFISNYKDAMILNSPASQKEIARQLADGIDEYFRK